ncbi:MAG: YbaB/EbfC family nucleoid-associated protein [Deltaproteobacteria bacterium]|nr:YbaB/EbfC family nucleoid-associated protein [Deltaproteobacteria bacterium]
MDLSNLMQMAGQLREQLAQAQAQARELRIEGEAGGGLVRVVMNGQHEVLEIVIDPKALADKALLEDLLRAAFNQASARVQESVRDRMGGFARSFGIDLSALGLGR